jgi:hypothetical protein
MPRGPVGALVASLAVAFSTPADALLKAIETAGKTPFEIIQEAGMLGVFQATEPLGHGEMGFLHVQSDVLCRVPEGSRMWLYSRSDGPIGESVSCSFTDDFRHVSVIAFREPLGPTLEDQLKVADAACLDHMPTPTTIMRDDAWEAPLRQDGLDTLSVRFRGEVPDEGPFYCAASVAVVNDWTFTFRFMARVYAEEEAERWDREALTRWETTLLPLLLSTPAE